LQEPRELANGHKTRSVFDRYNIVSEANLATATERLQAHLEEQPAGCGADHHSPNEEGQMTEHGQNTDIRMVSPKLLPKRLKKLVEPM
jgi:hypothetical protein